MGLVATPHGDLGKCLGTVRCVWMKTTTAATTTLKQVLSSSARGISRVHYRVLWGVDGCRKRKKKNKTSPGQQLHGWTGLRCITGYCEILPWMDEIEPSSIRRTLKLFQRQRWAPNWVLSGSSLKERERVIVNQTKTGTVSKATLGA